MKQSDSTAGRGKQMGNMATGICVCVCFVLMAVVIFRMGMTLQRINTRFDCDNYGKSLVGNDWYDCKKQEPKK